MRIFEVADPNGQKLMALSQFLSGRSDDESAKKQISQDAFIDLAKSLGVNVAPENLGELISKAPLSIFWNRWTQILVLSVLKATLKQKLE